MKRNLLLFMSNGLFTLAMFGLFLSYSAAQADDDGPVQAAVPSTISETFTYQGYLELDGAPVNDTCTTTFVFYPVAFGGTPVGAVQTYGGVKVSDGLFSVAIDAGTMFQNEARFIEITVNCGAGSETLAPRQEITAAPYAHTLRPGATISGGAIGSLNLVNAAEDGLRVDTTGGGDDGVQISAGDDGVYIVATGDDGIHIEAAGGDGVRVDDAVGGGVNVNGAQEHGVRGVTTSNAHYGGAFINDGVTDSDGAGLYARANSGTAADLVLAGNSSSGGGDNGIISSDPAFPSSDIFIDTNDGAVVRLDRDGDGEDADFSIENKDGETLLNVDESGAVWGDYNGSLDYVFPHALAHVDATGTEFAATDTIHSIAWNPAQNNYLVYLALTCAESDGLYSIMVQVTPSSPRQSSAIAQACNPNSTQRRLIKVTFTDTFGINQQSRFSLTVYRLRE